MKIVVRLYLWLVSKLVWSLVVRLMWQRLLCTKGAWGFLQSAGTGGGEGPSEPKLRRGGEKLNIISSFSVRLGPSCPPGGGPRLGRPARIQFGPVHFGEKPTWNHKNHEKPTWNHEKPTWNYEKLTLNNEKS